MIIFPINSSESKYPYSIQAGGVLVVGSGQSGCQIAQELHKHGFPVTLCVGRAGRLPRRYRGKDGMWWAHTLGVTEQTVDELDSPAERFAANPHISGKDGGQDINLHQFARDGIRLLGHLDALQNDTLLLADDLHENLAAADQQADQLRQGVDQYIRKTGLDVPEESVNEPTDGFDQEQLRTFNLHDHQIRTIIWATGFDRDYSWIKLPIFDEWSYPIQNRGVTEVPGLYFLGLHWMYQLKSGLFLGVGDDAKYLADYIDSQSTEEVSLE